MGVWHGLCIFDYSAFTQTVIPALQSGQTHPIVKRTIELLNAESGDIDCDFQGLERVVSKCDPDMISCSLGKNFIVHSSEIIPHREVKISPSDWGYWDFVNLFEWMVSRHAISHVYVFGRRPYCFEQLFGKSEWFNIDCYQEVFGSNLDELELLFEFERLIYPLLDSLDKNNSYWAHGSGGYGEGIRGWLNPEETKIILDIMNEFLFPDRDTALPVINNFQRLYRKLRDDYDEEALPMIEVFKKIVTRAVDLDRGLLWGADLDLFYSFEIFGENDIQPIDLNEVNAFNILNY